MRTRRRPRDETPAREANERILNTSAHLDLAPRLAAFLCECSNADCTEHVELALEEYRQLRTDPSHFLVRPGHERPKVERIVQRTDSFVVVEKNVHARTLDLLRGTSRRPELGS